MRDFTRSKLAGIFGDGPAVRNAEKAVYNWAVKRVREQGDTASWENRKFRYWYKQKVVELLAELKRGEMATLHLSITGDGRISVKIEIEPQLVWRLKRKELEMRKLATYRPDVLWPEGPWARAVLMHKEKELAMERAKAAEKDYEGLFKCNRCKSTKTSYYQMQTRSADGAFIICLLSFATLISRVFSPQSR